MDHGPVSSERTDDEAAGKCLLEVAFTLATSGSAQRRVTPTVEASPSHLPRRSNLASILLGITISPMRIGVSVVPAFLTGVAFLAAGPPNWRVRDPSSQIGAGGQKFRARLLNGRVTSGGRTHKAANVTAASGLGLGRLRLLALALRRS